MPPARNIASSPRRFTTWYAASRQAGGWICLPDARSRALTGGALKRPNHLTPPQPASAVQQAGRGMAGRPGVWRRLCLQSFSPRRVFFHIAYSTDSCHPIHGKVATQSTGSLPPSPRETCHSVHGKVATHSRRSLPPSERSDAGWHIISLNWLFLSTGPAVCAWILLVMEFCMRCGPDDRGWHRRASDLPGPHASARRGVGS